MDAYKLVSFVDKKPHLHQDMLTKFTDLANQDYPVCIISIIGPKKSNTAFYTNLLIEYLKTQTPNWLTNYSSRNETATKPFRMFSLKHNEDAENLNFDNKNESYGIYMFDKPYQVENYNGKVLVWILYYHQNPNSDLATEETMHLLMKMMCSRTAEIKFSRTKVSEIESKMSLDQLTLEKFVCSSMVRVLPGTSKSSDLILGFNADDIAQRVADESSKEILGKDATFKSQYLPSCNNCNESFSTFKLSLSAETHQKLDEDIKLVANVNELTSKVDEHGTSLYSSDMLSYFMDCIRLIEQNIRSQQRDGNDSELTRFYSRTDVTGSNLPCKTSNEISSCEDSFDLSTRLSKNIEPVRQDIMNDKQNCNDKKWGKKLNPVTMSDDFVDDVENEFKKQMNSGITEWFKRELTIADQDINHWKNIYDISINNALQIKIFEAKPLIHDKCKPYKEEINRVHEINASFHDQVRRLMRMQVCYPNSELLSVLGSPDISTETNINVADYVRHCCKKFTKLYSVHNSTIVKCEQYHVADCCKQIFRKYEDIISNTTLKTHCCPKWLLNFHKKLLQLCLKNLENALSFGSENEKRNLKTFVHIEAEKQLEVCIENSFKSYREKNALRLRNLHLDVMNLINKCKEEYCSDMDITLKNKKTGMPDKTFEEFHKTLAEKKVTIFKKRVHTLYASMPTQGYSVTLLGHINDLWESYKDSSRLKIQQNADCATKSCDNTNTTDGKTSKKKLMPIVFTVSQFEIGTHIKHDNGNKISKTINATVGQTENDIYECGFDPPTSNIDNKFTNAWHLKDFLFKTGTNNNKTHDTDSNGRKLTIEFILGYLLKTLKETVESELLGSVDECVITIPFWLTSTQRQAVKNSGNVAGFLNTYLLNENSAVAYDAYISGTVDKDIEIVLFLENSNIIDVSIYGFNIRTGEVNMKSYCNGNHNIQTMPTLFTKIIPHYEKVRETYNAAKKSYLQMHTYELNTKEKVVLISSSESHKAILNSVAHQITHKKYCKVLNDSNVQGALSYAKDPKNVGKNIKELVPRIMGQTGSNKLDPYEKNNCQLPNTQKFAITQKESRNYKETSEFYQKDIHNNKAVLGKLQFAHHNMTIEHVDASFDISSESIVSFILPEVNELYGCSWTPTSLNEAEISKIGLHVTNQRARCVNLIELSKKKEMFIRQGNVLLDKAKNANSFKSDLAKTMVVSQIDGALKVLNHPKVTLNDIDAQSEVFKNFEKLIQESS